MLVIETVCHKAWWYSMYCIFLKVLYSLLVEEVPEGTRRTGCMMNFMLIDLLLVLLLTQAQIDWRDWITQVMAA